MRTSLRAILALGYFRRVKPVGIHRPLQYHRVLLPNEGPQDFVGRIQGDDNNSDLCVLLHWIACDMTAKTGEAQFRTPPEWTASRGAVKLARRKMHSLGYFAIDSDSRRGAPATYRRRRMTEADLRDSSRRADAADKKQAADPVLRKADKKQAADPVPREKYDARRREFEASEFGLGQPVRPDRLSKKRVITHFGEE